MVSLHSARHSVQRLVDHRRYVVGLVLFAVVLRFVAIAVVGQDVLYSDGADYFALADRLSDTHRYGLADGSEIAYRPVGYPGFLAALLSVFGSHALVAQVANAGLQVGAMLLLLDVGQRTLLTSRQARIGATLLAMHPNAVLHATLVQTESLALFLTALCAWSLVRYRGALGGLAWGLLVLVKPPYLLLLPLLAPWSKTSNKRGVTLVAIAAVVGLALAVVPWSARNAVDAGRPVFVASNAGSNLRIGHNPYADGTYDLPAPLVPEFEETAHLSEWDRSDVLAANAVEWIVANPAAQAKLIAYRGVHLWVHDADAIRILRTIGSRAGHAMPSVAYVSGVLLSMGFYVGVWLSLLVGIWRDPRLMLSMPVRVAVLISLIHMAFFGGARFHFVPLALLVMLVPLAWAPRPRASERHHGSTAVGERH